MYDYISLWNNLLYSSTSYTKQYWISISTAKYDKTTKISFSLRFFVQGIFCEVFCSRKLIGYQASS